MKTADENNRIAQMQVYPISAPAGEQTPRSSAVLCIENDKPSLWGSVGWCMRMNVRHIRHKEGEGMDQEDADG